MAGSSTASSKRTLEELFRPPIDMMFNGNLQAVSLLMLSKIFISNILCYYTVTGSRHGEVH